MKNVTSYGGVGGKLTGPAADAARVDWVGKDIYKRGERGKDSTNTPKRHWVNLYIVRLITD